MLNIVFNTYPFAFAPPGGGEIQLLQYKRQLERLGIDVSLFDLWQGEGQFSKDSVLHFFSCMPGSAPFLNFFAAKEVPIVVSPNLWITKETANRYPFAEIRAVLIIADAVVCNSNMEGDRLSEVFDLPRSKFFTVYNGVSETYFTPVNPGVFRSTFGISGKFVLNVANVEPRKNQLGLVRAMKHFPDHKLVVVGHVRDQSYADLCADEGGEQLRYLGNLPYGSDLIRSAFSACELFALPSTLETPGLAALEAAACGCSLIITKEGSTFEYFGNDAMYVNPDSVDSIVRAIRSAIVSCPTSMKSRIESTFSWQHVIQDLIPVYEELQTYRKSKEVFFSGAGISDAGFYAPERDDDGWFVWSQRESSLKTRGGLLAWRWWALTEIAVDLYLDGSLYRSGIKVGACWAPYGLELPPAEGEVMHELSIRVRGEVIEQGSRELGLMMRDLARYDETALTGEGREQWCLQRGLIFEAAGLQGEGFYPAEHDEIGWLVWGKSACRLLTSRGRLAFECFVAQRSRVMFETDEPTEAARSVVLHAGSSEFEMDFSAEGREERIRIDVRVEMLEPIRHSDPRDLGIAIRSVRVTT